MALPNLKPVSRRYAHAYMADIGTAGSAYTVSPVRGRITKVWTTIYAAPTGSDANFTLEINNVAVTGVAWVVTVSGSAAGDVDSAVPTSLALSRVIEGDTIEFVTDGASSSTVPAMCVAEIEMD